MLNDAIKLGDKLNIEQIAGTSEKKYISKLLDMSEDGTISAAMPIEKNQLILLEVGIRYRVTFYTEKGLYACDSIVTKRYKVNNVYVAELKALETPRKIQRREYYRFPCLLEIEYYVFQEKEYEQALQKIENSNTSYGCSEQQKMIRAIELLKDSDAKYDTNLIQKKKALATDISGGGMRFRTTEEITQKKDLFLVFSLNQGLSNYYVFGDLISSEKSNTKSNIFEHRLKFTIISAEEREQIVRYVLNEERKLRQKEKGFC